IGKLLPIYAARLEEWRLNSTMPIATSIISDSEDGIVRLVEASPQADFYLPGNTLGRVHPIATFTHQEIVLPNGRILLLSRRSPLSTPRGSPRSMPQQW